MRTHICHGCGMVLDRDHNAALNILQKAVNGTEGQSVTSGHVRQNARDETGPLLLALEKV